VRCEASSAATGSRRCFFLVILPAIKASHRLSLADAIIAAFALQHQAVLIHKDPEFEPLSGHVMLEALPYAR
jgi:ribonuclease VapC